jgi:hypothetical protein
MSMFLYAFPNFTLFLRFNTLQSFTVFGILNKGDEAFSSYSIGTKSILGYITC